MARVALTARFVEKVKSDPARQIDYFDVNEPGLVLRVAPSGRKTWCYYYRPLGTRRKRRLSLGTFPAMSLAKARERTLDNRRAVEVEGKDPAAQKAAWKQIDTFQQLTAWYLKEYAKRHKRPKSAAEDERILRKELLPAWRDRKANDVTRSDVRGLLKAIADRPAPVMANRVLALISRIYTKALEEDVPGIVTNPALRLPKPGGEERGRDRVLTDDEIRVLWAVLEDARKPKRRGAEDDVTAPIAPMIARGLQVILLTGQRPGEVFRMKWAHVDLEAKWWEMPESATKNRIAHRVPLTDRVVEILEEAKEQAPKDSKWVFAGMKGGSVAARALKAGAELARAVGKDGEPLLGFAFHRHDLRRTCATNLARIGVPSPTISRVLNHIDRGPRATATYQRYTFDTEKRAALEAWNRALSAILSKEAARAVLPFVRP